MNSPDPNIAVALLLGAAVGDALGLPAEGMRPATIRRRWKGPWRMRLFLGRGFFSDDTEHHLMVAQAVVASPTDPHRFQACLGWKLRWWFASLPAGVGLATARACLKLWLGFPAHRAAVDSGGAGPAMRSAILGHLFADDPVRRRAYVEAASQVTHKGWQAVLAAHAISEAVALASTKGSMPDSATVLAHLRGLSAQPEWHGLLDAMKAALESDRSVAEFASDLGLARGITGYALHVVPMALFAWLRHPLSFREPLLAILDCGGDTDTAGAVVGALAGVTAGRDAIPGEWIDSIADWPRSVRFIQAVADRAVLVVTSGTPGNGVPLPWPVIPVRNLAFLVVVLLHGIRRLLPPY